MRILLVEDEEKLARFLVRGLREEGHQLDQCTHGKDARSRIEALGYDVIVLATPDHPRSEVGDLDLPVLVLDALERATANHGCSDRASSRWVGATGAGLDASGRDP
jgi:CheY-like chemotaxis protein